MKFIVSQGGPKVPSKAMVTASLGIGPGEEVGLGLTTALSIALPGVSPDGAEALVAKAPSGMPPFQCDPRQYGREIDPE
jgi:osmotically inducible protein OsmC